MSCPRRAFTAAELRTLRQMAAAGHSAGEIGAKLSRGSKTILGKADRLGIVVKRVCEKHRWTADQDVTLRLNYPRFPAFLIAHVLGMSVSQVENRAWHLRLEKAPDFWTQPNARLWSGYDHPNSVASRFKPGVVPPNKGTRRPGYAPGRMAETMFKKGRPACEARNYVPIGTEKLDTKRGVLVRKMTDDPSLFPVNRWTPVHVLAWRDAHGPVPAGHIIRFRAGMKTLVAAEITVDKLECVSLAENMRRNTIHNQPGPIADAMRMRGVLNRAIRKHSRSRGDSAPTPEETAP